MNARIDPDCAALAAAFLRRTPRRPPEGLSSSGDPMYRRTGGSFDLKNIRDYSPGDDPRRVDTKLFARTGKLFVKEFFLEDADGLCVLVDISSSMRRTSPFEAERFAASLVWMLSILKVPVDLFLFSEGIDASFRRPHGGFSGDDIERFFDLAAAGLKPQGVRLKTDMVAAVSQARAATRYRRAVIVSDFHDPDFRAEALPFSRTWLFAWRARFPLDPEAQDEIELLDPESGRTLRLSREAIILASGPGCEPGGSLRKAQAAYPRRISFDSFSEGDSLVPLWWRFLEELHG